MYDISDYQKLLNGFSYEMKKSLDRKGIESLDYNIFSILRTYFSEVNTHTPFLSNLLNPNGSHGQGDLFYREFVKKIIPDKKIEAFLNVNSNDLYVKSEKRNPYGQIDIGIYSTKPGNRFALIIENKIRAGDQYRQLYRYYQYASQSLSLEDNKISIIYLKPNDSLPDISHLSDQEAQQLKSVLTQVRYVSQNDETDLAIDVFLSECLPYIKSNKVKNTIEQYISTIKKLF